MSDTTAPSAEAGPSTTSPRSSLDTATLPTNGKSSSNHNHDSDAEDEDSGWAPISTLTADQISTELVRVREERDTFESQYRSLLSKLTTMRATLGDRLRQDAEELDRRETQIEALTAKIDTLESNTATIRAELVDSHAETDRLTREVDTLRTTLATHQQAEQQQEEARGKGGRVERERELHELVERVKLDAHGWESACLEERAKREDLESRLSETQHSTRGSTTERNPSKAGGGKRSCKRSQLERRAERVSVELRPGTFACARRPPFATRYAFFFPRRLQG